MANQAALSQINVGVVAAADGSASNAARIRVVKAGANTGGDAVGRDAGLWRLVGRGRGTEVGRFIGKVDADNVDALGDGIVAG
jgi:hypothetical protein